MRCEHRIAQEPVQVIAGLRFRRGPGIFGTPQEAVAPACLTQMVLRGASPQRGAKKHVALRGGSEMPRLVCCRISQTHYSESARSSAALTGHFRAIAIPAITRTGSQHTTHRQHAVRRLATAVRKVAEVVSIAAVLGLPINRASGHAESYQTAFALQKHGL